MKRIRLKEECIKCLLDKYETRRPETDDEALVQKYKEEYKKIILSATKDMSAPEIVALINELQTKIFGTYVNFESVKNYYNNLMLNLEEDIKAQILNSENPLKTATKYAMLGNYIDFGAMKSVDELKLFDLIQNVDKIEIDEAEFNRFCDELSKAKELAFLTDNCGEIVFDKLLIKLIKKTFPKLKITVIVRGTPVLNDATLSDAQAVGLDKVCPVIDNGTNIAGTSINKISDKALNVIKRADVIISKGQGNFETLSYCGLNVYYVFLCKCKMFASLFGVKEFTGMFVNDLRLK